jgi:hypothetical protein
MPSKTPNGEGFVYLAKFKLFENCYKIGSTSNIRGRLAALENSFGSTDFVIYGCVKNKVSAEREIQKILHKCSNNAIIAECMLNHLSEDDILKRLCPGSPISIEHFVFTENDVSTVKSAFESVCECTKYLNGWGES